MKTPLLLLPDRFLPVLCCINKRDEIWKVTYLWGKEYIADVIPISLHLKDVLEIHHIFLD